jgi:single-strand DNA-binding protein
MIIGNLCSDPENRVTATGKNVCSFSVAVNRRGGNEADFFRVSAWEKNAENCGKYLSKGRKVCVVGPVSVRTYQANNGETRASLEVTANEVEFLSAKSEGNQSGGFTVVNVEDDPFA